MHQQSKNSYKIIGKKSELTDVVTLQFVKSSDASVPTFISGQYIDVFHENPAISEGKSYSISSVPGDNFLSITIKIMGEFSRYLTNLNEGDILIASDPYGYFYSERDDTSLIFLAGGIGITPMWSMIRFFSQHKPNRKLKLFYSNARVDSILFRDALLALENSNSNFKATFFVTKQESIARGYNKGRMSPLQIVEALQSEPGNVRENEFLVCGSIHFVKDMWNGLKAAGVDEGQIYTEAFFSH